jgi:hypothetical protein
MEKNPAREREIYSLWIKGYKIAQIHELTGIPISSVGYYTKKFKDVEKLGKHTGPSLEEVLGRMQADTKLDKISGPPIYGAQPGFKDYDITEPRMKKTNTETEGSIYTRRQELSKISKASLIFMDDSYAKMREKFTQLMQQGQYTQAKDLCDAALSYSKLSQKFLNIMKDREKITYWDYYVLTSIYK